ncbi:helix-turn-helix transcriptional regulator [Vreelandella aquamarina]|uniref:helix-turn-helix transcriptional regulator n=1 Tax=Vreelandella aquamarina TaxID=77097 RepID=UPI00384BB36B
MFNAMSRAEIWLQDTLDQSLSIEDLANHLGYSASQVRRQFRHCFNTSPNAYREQRRLERAAVLLSLTPQNIAHIAIRCGYANHSSFSRAFQRRYQLTPRHYRQALSDMRHLTPPRKQFTTTIEKSRPRQAIFMRVYKAPDAIKGLGNTSCHSSHLACFEAHLSCATPTVALPDLLADKVEALDTQANTHTFRTDIGLYLDPSANTESLALPVDYRRVEIPSQHYAKTRFDGFDELSDALTATLRQLANQTHRFYVSGEAPRVLWQSDHLELRIPLLG